MICKHLALSMGGEVGVQSTRGVGSLFWFTARLGAVDPAEIAKARPPVANVEAELRASHAGKRVLLAEDNTVNQEVIGMLLAHVGLVVDLAPDGEQAVAMTRAREYALILMDLQMPVMNGATAVRIVRTIPERELVPIIALTASVFEEDRELCINAGMDDHIGKPVVPEVLFATLLKWLH